MRLPLMSDVTKLPKSNTTELPGPLLTSSTGPALVLPVPICHWPEPSPMVQVRPVTSNSGSGR
ncbi:hypothetical protein D3C78_705200 [compost metagenome]